ncbi:MAG: acyl dehydratase [Burkholderiales bacterium]|nr:acyl dehydratase [Burkholderiales bacterium]MBK9345872.1 acyl dehydratase [Burkholderiales bacterium]
MHTVEVLSEPHLASVLVSALASSTKRPGVVKKLKPVTLVRPQVVLDAAHIARYNAICGFKAEQGVPLIYPQMLTFPLVMSFFGSEACPWPALGTVHLANRIAQKKSLRAGDTVRVEMQTGELFAHEKGQGFNLDLRILRDDEVVWSATQSLLRVGVKQKSGEPYASAVTDDAPLSRQADFNAASDLGRRYGEVSGDRNPIHLTAVSAKLFGFRRAIAHGMWTKARALSCLLPAQQLEQASVAVDFKTPLFLPSRASLWSARKSDGALFEVRDAKGQRPHLRGQLQY